MERSELLTLIRDVLDMKPDDPAEAITDAIVGTVAVEAWGNLSPLQQQKFLNLFGGGV
jgi:hypothetical protein